MSKKITNPLGDWALWWLARHWLALVNLFFITYIVLPLLAPVLLTFGFSRPALSIYRLYSLTCHQLPDHSYFIFGHQVALCQRCTAIHGTMALAGLLYIMLRYRSLSPLSLRWYLLFLIPVGLDGGMQMVSDLLVFIPAFVLWGLGLTVIIVISLILYFQKAFVWQAGVFFLAGPLALLFVQWFGPYESDWLRRTLTGMLYALGTIWLVYPSLEVEFRELRSVFGDGQGRLGKLT